MTWQMAVQAVAWLLVGGAFGYLMKSLAVASQDQLDSRAVRKHLMQQRLEDLQRTLARHEQERARCEYESRNHAA